MYNNRFVMHVSFLYSTLKNISLCNCISLVKVEVKRDKSTVIQIRSSRGTMKILLIFIVVSLSTIDADRYPSFNTKHLKVLDTRTNVKPHLSPFQFCNKLWSSVKVLPGSAQKTFLGLMQAIVKGEEIFQNVVRRSLVYGIQLVETRVKKDKKNKQEKPEMSSEFMNTCITMWDKVVEFSPSSQARIRTKLLGILEGAKHNLVNNEPAFSEITPQMTDNEPESEGEDGDDPVDTTEEPQNNNEDDDIPPSENVNQIDESDDGDGNDDGKNGNNEVDNDKNGDNEEDDDDPNNLPKRNLGYQIYVIKPGQFPNGIFDRRRNKLFKKAH